MQDETVSRALYDAMRMALKDIEAVLGRHGCPPGATMTDWVDEQLTALAAATKPIDMLLLCPNCGVQHIDAVETGTALSRSGLDTLTETEVVTWSNPPHRSHMCHSCGHQWRPADVATNGVAELKTKGKNDSPRVVREIEPFAQCPHGDNAATCGLCGSIDPNDLSVWEELAQRSWAGAKMRLCIRHEPTGIEVKQADLRLSAHRARAELMAELERKVAAAQRAEPGADERTPEDDLNATESVLDAAMCDMPEGFQTDYPTVSAYAHAIWQRYRKMLEEARAGQQPPLPKGLRGFSPRGDFAVELRFHSCRLAQAYLHDIANQIANNMPQETAQ